MSFFQNLIINAVYLYQQTAPENLRKSCRFTPSCSEYMILAVKKYGAIKGVYMGLKRIFRCHAPNGGEDYP